MADSLSADICVIGAGSAGLSVAAGASQMGADTVLIEPNTYTLSIPGAGEDGAATGDLDITGPLTFAIESTV